MDADRKTSPPAMAPAPPPPLPLSSALAPSSVAARCESSPAARVKVGTSSLCCRAQGGSREEQDWWGSVHEKIWAEPCATCRQSSMCNTKIGPAA